MSLVLDWILSMVVVQVSIFLFPFLVPVSNLHLKWTFFFVSKRDFSFSCKVFFALIFFQSVELFCKPALAPIPYLRGDECHDDTSNEGPGPEEGVSLVEGVVSIGATPGVSPGLVPQPGVFQSARGQPLLDLLKLRGVLADGALRRLPVRNLDSSTTHLDPYSKYTPYWKMCTQAYWEKVNKCSECSVIISGYQCLLFHSTHNFDVSFSIFISHVPGFVGDIRGCVYITLT